MESLAKILDAIAWPVLVFIIFIQSKEHLSSLLERVSSVKHKDFEMVFNDSMKHIAKALGEHSVKKIDSDAQDLKSSLIEMAYTSPRGAILESWMYLCEKMRNILKIDVGESQYSYFSMVEKISHDDRNMRGALHSLRMLRNEVVHSPVQVSPDTALQYIDAAFSVAASLEAK